MRSLVYILFLLLIACGHQEAGTSSITSTDSTASTRESRRQNANAAFYRYEPPTTRKDITIEQVYEGEDPYLVMNATFTGNPDRETLQMLIIPLMERHDMMVNNTNLMRVANVLHSLKENSRYGISEMQILLHANRNHIKGIPISEQLGVAAAALEPAP